MHTEMTALSFAEQHHNQSIEILKEKYREGYREEVDKAVALVNLFGDRETKLALERTLLGDNPFLVSLLIDIFDFVYETVERRN